MVTDVDVAVAMVRVLLLARRGFEMACNDFFTFTLASIVEIPA